MGPQKVWLEPASGTRVLVGSDLPDIEAANLVAPRWRELAVTQPDRPHGTAPGSGCIVRASAIIAITAHEQPKPSKLDGLITAPRPGVWL